VDSISTTVSWAKSQGNSQSIGENCLNGLTQRKKYKTRHEKCGSLSKDSTGTFYSCVGNIFIYMCVCINKWTQWI